MNFARGARILQKGWNRAGELELNEPESWIARELGSQIAKARARELML